MAPVEFANHELINGQNHLRLESKHHHHHHHIQGGKNTRAIVLTNMDKIIIFDFKSKHRHIKGEKILMQW